MLNVHPKSPRVDDGSSESRPACRGTGCTRRAEHRDGQAEKAGGRVYPLETTGVRDGWSSAGQRKGVEGALPERHRLRSALGSLAPEEFAASSGQADLAG